MLKPSTSASFDLDAQGQDHRPAGSGVSRPAPAGVGAVAHAQPPGDQLLDAQEFRSEHPRGCHRRDNSAAASSKSGRRTASPSRCRSPPGGPRPARPGTTPGARSSARARTLRSPDSVPRTQTRTRTTSSRTCTNTAIGQNHQRRRRRRTGAGAAPAQAQHPPVRSPDPGGLRCRSGPGSSVAPSCVSVGAHCLPLRIASAVMCRRCFIDRAPGSGAAETRPGPWSRHRRPPPEPGRRGCASARRCRRSLQIPARSLDRRRCRSR